MREALRVAAQQGQLGEDVIERVLAFARAHLGMDVAWVTHVADGVSVIEVLDGAAATFGVAVGSTTRHQLGARVVAGELPGVVPDVYRDVRTKDLAVTRELGIGAYVGAPLRLPDGRLYGMLACLSRNPDPSLRERDSQFLQLVAEILTPSIVEREQRRDRRATIGARVQTVLDDGGPRMVFQPILALPGQSIVGYEALARFPFGHGGPDQWFADAAEVGLGGVLELAAANAGLRALDSLPPTTAIAINVSAETATTEALINAVTGRCGRRVIVEITEHTPISDYAPLLTAIHRMRAAGAKIACDDAGSGYAGFQHLVELQPDIIKLDYQITHRLDTDPARNAMAKALVSFADATSATILAEGIETSTELATATDLGITLAQGYHLGHPGPLPSTSPARQARRAEPGKPAEIPGTARLSHETVGGHR